MISLPFHGKTTADLGINLSISLALPTAASEAVSRGAMVQGLPAASVALAALMKTSL